MNVKSGKATRWAVVAVALVVGGAASWWPLTGGGSSGPLAEADAATVAAGRPIYDQYCASCHGANLEGQPDWRTRKANGRLPAPPHDDTGHTWHHPDQVLLAITRHGVKPPLAPEGYQSDMPGFEGTLSEAQIRAVLAYIASRWSEQSRAFQLKVNRGG